MHYLLFITLAAVFYFSVSSHSRPQPQQKSAPLQQPEPRARVEKALATSLRAPDPQPLGDNANVKAPPLDLPPGWRAFTDPTTQNMFYHHSVTGETTWTKPGVAGGAGGAPPRPPGTHTAPPAAPIAPKQLPPATPTPKPPTIAWPPPQSSERPADPNGRPCTCAIYKNLMQDNRWVLQTYCDFDNSKALPAGCKPGCAFVGGKGHAGKGVCVSAPDVGEEEANAAMNRRLEGIRRRYPELTNVNKKGTPGKYFDTMRAPVDCPTLLMDESLDAQREQQKPPRGIPAKWQSEWTMQGRLKIGSFYFDGSEAYLGGTALENTWTKAKVENWKAQAAAGTLNGNYGVSNTNNVMEAVRVADLTGKRVMVVGSENPWVEAVCLAAGAREVVTLEYGTINSEHPQISSMTPAQMRAAYKAGTLGLFDAIVSFSSLEHSGLGRYGDALNPWADILAVARCWCVTKEGGQLINGFNWAATGEGIQYNAHRIYGPVRMPYFSTNWEQVWGADKTGQRMFVWRKLPAVDASSNTKHGVPQLHSRQTQSTF